MFQMCSGIPELFPWFCCCCCCLISSTPCLPPPIPIPPSTLHYYLSKFRGLLPGFISASGASSAEWRGQWYRTKPMRNQCSGPTLFLSLFPSSSLSFSLSLSLSDSFFRYLSQLRIPERFRRKKKEKEKRKRKNIELWHLYQSFAINFKFVSHFSTFDNLFSIYSIQCVCVCVCACACVWVRMNSGTIASNQNLPNEKKCN